jgi:hypothetical protein
VTAGVGFALRGATGTDAGGIAAGDRKERWAVTVGPTTTHTPEQWARGRAKYLSGLLWHTGAFVIINVFFWILDLTLAGGGLDWAFWITLVWGFALAFHALAYYVDGRGVEERRYERYLAEARRRGPGGDRGNGDRE